MRTKCTRCG